jgi:hypothetical protein
MNVVFGAIIGAIRNGAIRNGAIRRLGLWGAEAHFVARGHVYQRPCQPRPVYGVHADTSRLTNIKNCWEKRTGKTAR